MKLLLDEQLPRTLTRHFPTDFTVDHVQRLGWESTKNGELLKLAASAGYDALITADKNMSYQQNRKALPVSVVELHVVRLTIEALTPLLPRAIERLQEVTEPTFVRIDAEPDDATDT